jgi:hypothetical protein
VAVRVSASILIALSVWACGAEPRERRVEASYDRQTGQLSQLKVDAVKDGKPDIFSYMNGKNFVRIEITTTRTGRSIGGSTTARIKKS